MTDAMPITTPSVDNAVRSGLTAISEKPWRTDARAAGYMPLRIGAIGEARYCPEDAASLQLSLDAPAVVPCDNHVMPSQTDRDLIEPLFAYNKRLWVRVWVATQAAAIGVAIYTMVGRAGGLDAFLHSPVSVRSA